MTTIQREMAFATVYYTNRSPRSNWLTDLGTYVGLDIVGVCVDDPCKSPYFSTEFPLKKNPSLVTSSSFKLTETVAIIRYIISKSEKPYFFGSNIEVRASCLSWLSFFSMDYMNAARDMFFNETREAKQLSIMKVRSLLEYVNDSVGLVERKYLCCNVILVADIFAFKLVNIATSSGVEISDLKRLALYMNSVRLHPLIIKVTEASPLL